MTGQQINPRYEKDIPTQVDGATLIWAVYISKCFLHKLIETFFIWCVVAEDALDSRAMSQS